MRMRAATTTGPLHASRWLLTGLLQKPCDPAPAGGKGHSARLSPDAEVGGGEAVAVHQDAIGVLAIR
eukprot:2064429-Alexandrium_andersonii.AAC.1